MNDAMEFNPATFVADRRARLARIDAAAARLQERARMPAKIIESVQPAEAPDQPAVGLLLVHTVDGELTKRPPAMHEIINAVAVRYGFTRLDIRSARRPAPLSRARQVACYLCRRLTLKSLPEIGRYLGNRDHTTILHAVRVIDRLIIQDPNVASDITGLIAILGGEEDAS